MAQPSRFEIYLESYPNDYKITSWNDVTITSQVSGYGITGCTTTMLKFTAFDSFAQVIGNNARVTIIDTLGAFVFPLFYVQSRSIKNKRCEFTCVDIMSNADDTFNTSWILDTVDNVDLGTVVDKIALQIGAAGAAYTIAGWREITENKMYSKTHFLNKSCRVILDEIAAALMGSWGIYDGQLLLVGMASGIARTVDIDTFTKIDLGNVQTVSGLEMTNSDNGDIFSFGNYSGKRFYISSYYADSNHSEALFNSINGYRYEAFSCSKCLVESFVYVNSFVRFMYSDDDFDVRLANNVTLKISGDKVYATFIRNSVSELEMPYKSLLQRDMEQKLQADKAVGTTTIESSGKIVFRNLNKTGVG